LLVLTRKHGERIHIGDDVVITVTSVRGGQVRLGIQAPPGVRIVRKELLKDPAKKTKRKPPRRE
jgi:carbon storage regulator